MAIESIAAIRAAASTTATSGAPATANGGTAFTEVLKEVMAGEAAASAKADQAIQAMAVGKAEGLHQVTMAVAQADLQFRLILELRNRLTEAYQEVMRMQV